MISVSLFKFYLKEDNSLGYIQLAEKLVYITKNYLLTIIMQQPKQQLCSLEKSHVWNIPDLIKCHGIVNNMVKEIKCMLTKLLYENI